MARLRAALSAAGYKNDVVGPARREYPYTLAERPQVTEATGGVDGPLRDLLQLFALRAPVPRERAAAAVAPASLGELQAAGLVEIGDSEVLANYALSPHGEFLFAGDFSLEDNSESVSPVNNSSLTLARLVPPVERHRMLDLGTGSGVQAILAAAYCQEITAVDINPRALSIARLNAALNQIDNVRFAEGSWLEPLGAERFDLIVANPPYVVSPDQEFTYRDSGLPPGALLAQLCREIPSHLEEGGLAIMLVNWPHRLDVDWAELPSRWIEEAGCDGILIRHETDDPLAYAGSWNVPPAAFMDPATLRQTVTRWLRYYEEIGAGAISFGALVLRRRAGGAQRITMLKADRLLGKLAGTQLARLIEGLDLARSLDDAELLTTTFSLCEGTDITQRFHHDERTFIARPAMVGLTDGLGIRAAVDPDALDVVFACDGRGSLAEIVRSASQRRNQSAESMTRLAIEAVRELLAHGLMTVCKGT